jgi:hypothetical protein
VPRLAVPLPGGDVREVLVVALGLALLGLVLLAEVPAAGLLAVRASRHISSPSSKKSATRPAFSSELSSGCREPSTRTSASNSSRSAGISDSAFSSPAWVARHPAVVPQDLAELPVEPVHRPGALGREEPVEPVRDVRLGLVNAGAVRCRPATRRACRRGSRRSCTAGRSSRRPGPASAPRRRAGWRRGRRSWPHRWRTGPGSWSQVVVDPQPAHRVVRGGVDAHRGLVRVLPGDALVHLEQVAVAVGDASRRAGRSRPAKSR